jgi:hypothetical protein
MKGKLKRKESLVPNGERLPLLPGRYRTQDVVERGAERQMDIGILPFKARKRYPT